MSLRATTPLVLVISLGVLLALPREASAEKRRIVVIGIEGDRKSRLQRSLKKLIRRRHRTVSRRRYRRAARRERAGTLQARDVRRVCRVVECDGVVEGELKRRGRGYRLVLRLREGATGKVKRRVSVRLRSRRLSRRKVRQLRRRLLPAIRKLEPIDFADLDEPELVADAGDPGADDIDDDDGFEEEDVDYEELPEPDIDAELDEENPLDSLPPSRF